ncbi:sugar transporter [Gluconacetobacter diazotrophicus PA1 5]|uniref:Putative galactose-proton symporter n=1 Tax=Gluconacetobacter diazotrophicus (strain ATCC 49037 / DSM 5601 / CCUG 37298 / CIP 103539 / LMG 7603 / PAl5) TaxID=272568 RepID=A9H124_GLUDA|nr:sugar porter family MFS transporter [Gluconacetobacter diazotrophicus]ACI52838.1 sugar transporter [Gluconacetobacter diazotrophicus PA1 5]TWB09017.1 SP family galactose:H+ symporter-like MFS transporter [Gluconacetobacter diazotrophicus]CAP57199.1 putative galactose-proton symporter [Gluconacetobacter diazotrophicus PA1 5]
MSPDQGPAGTMPVNGSVPSSGARAIVVGILAAMAGLMFGLDTGVIAGALGFIGDEFHAAARMQEWIVSSMMVAATVGSVVAGRISFRFGRRRALLGASLLFLAGSMICALAPSITVLIVGRVLLGLAVGIAAFAAPLYISEVTAEAVRGAMISFYQLMVTLGIFLAYVTDSVLAYGGHWRWMLGLMAVPAALFCAACLFLPDSPRWLMMRGERSRASQVMRYLRPDPAEADAEIRDIAQELRKESGSGFALFRSNANFRRSVLLGVMLQVMQQLTGINVLMYYAPKVFQAAHFGVSAATWATALIGLINVLSTGFAIAFIDRWGRRPLLILSCAIMTFAMLGAGGLIAFGGDSLPQEIGMVGALLLFVAGFAIGAGPLVWTLCSEIQPLRGRDFGIACSTFTNWAANSLVSNVFLTVMAALGEARTFWLFALMNGLFIIITLAYVPETRGVSLEEIEARLMAGRRLRDLGQDTTGRGAEA